MMQTPATLVVPHFNDLNDSSSSHVSATPTAQPTQQHHQQQQQQQQQRYRYQNEIQAMMYTFGDVRHPLPATTLLMEDILHNQMIELVRRRRR